METSEKITIEEVVKREGQYVGPTVGVSMLPMLKTGRDTIVVKRKTARLDALDVALYKRGENYVLHRVIRQTESGYIIRGDNCYVDEIVNEADVFGVLTEYFKKDEKIDCKTNKKYLRYARKRVKRYKVRRFFVLPYRKAKGVLRKAYRLLFKRGVKKGE